MLNHVRISKRGLRPLCIIGAENRKRKEMKLGGTGQPCAKETASRSSLATFWIQTPWKVSATRSQGIDEQICDRQIVTKGGKISRFLRWLSRPSLHDGLSCPAETCCQSFTCKLDDTRQCQSVSVMT